MSKIKYFLLWFISMIFSSIISVFLIFALFILIFIGGIMSLDFLGGHLDKGKIPTNGYLEVSFPYEVSESKTSNMFFNFQENINFYSVLEGIEASLYDENISAIYLNLDNWNLSMEQTSELANFFEEKNYYVDCDHEDESDCSETCTLPLKKVYGYATFLDKKTYLAASICNVLVMPDTQSAMINLSGFHTEMIYFKDFLDKIGVELKIIHIGDFKSFGEEFYRQNMSPELAAELEKIYMSIFVCWGGAIGSRCENFDFGKMLKGEYSLLTAPEALNENLVDELSTFDDFRDKYLQSKNAINLVNYSKNHLITTDANIAVVVLEGEIVNADSKGEGFFTEDTGINPHKTSRIFANILKDKNIKAVVLRINSPGGSALASEIIYQQILNLKKQLPVYVSMGNVAASGGYYISTPANKIFADSFTITGSIGVVAMIPNIADLSNKIGINFCTVALGENAPLFSIGEKMSPEKEDLIRHKMNLTYQEFLNRVSLNREIDIKKLHDEIAQGRIWTGVDAKECGLVDEVGGLYNVFEAVVEDLKLNSFVTKVYDDNNFWNKFNLIFENFSSEKVFLNKVLTTELKPVIKSLKMAKELDGKPAYFCPLQIK